MSRPIYEPNLERADASLGYDKAQLQRRPAPESAAGGTFMGEWYSDTSNTNLNAAMTVLNWNGDGIGPGNYDLSVPTYDINANDNLVIGKDGLYIFAMMVEFPVILTTPDKTVITDISFPSGAQPDMISPLAGTGPRSEVIREVIETDSDTDILQNLMPNYMQMFWYASGTIGTGGPSELEIEFGYTEDNAFTANSNFNWRMAIARVAPPWVDP